jgi:hypothetical protein
VLFYPLDISSAVSVSLRQWLAWDVILGNGLAKVSPEAVGIGVTEMSEVAIGPGDDVVSRLVGAKEGDVKFVFCSDGTFSPKHRLGFASICYFSDKEPELVGWPQLVNLLAVQIGPDFLMILSG